MTASVQGNKSNYTQEVVKKEHFLIWTGQYNVHIFSKFCLRQRDEWGQTDIYKTQTVGNT